jgi:hypothetical protein
VFAIGYDSTTLQDVYIGSTIYSPTGAKLATPPLPELQSVQPVTSDTVHSPEQNTIYSLSSGEKVWTSPYLTNDPYLPPKLGAIAGPYVVFEFEGRVIAVKY